MYVKRRVVTEEYCNRWLDEYDATVQEWIDGKLSSEYAKDDAGLVWRKFCKTQIRLENACDRGTRTRIADLKARVFEAMSDTNAFVLAIDEFEKTNIGGDDTQAVRRHFLQSARARRK